MTEDLRHLPAGLDRDFLNWFGGFFDGEGFVTFRDRPNGRHFIMGASQSGERGRRIIAEICDRATVGRTRKYDRPGCLPMWEWRLTRVHDILWFGNVLVPHLRVKRGDLELMLETAASALPTMKSPAWSRRDIEFLRASYRDATLEQLGIKLGRSAKAIDGKLGELGIGRRRDQWTK